MDVDDTSAVTANSASPSGVRSAWVPKSVMWPQGMPILRVKFLNTIPSNWTYKGSGLNLGNIEQWANIWHDRGGGQIPEFQFVVAEDAPSDVRVMFVGKFVWCI